jgi:UDP-N-acetyl-D-mannosaminuronate dehydrogenase
MFRPEELAELGFAPWQRGEPADVAILQADHADYREYGAADIPGVAVVVDGRKALDPDRFAGVTFVVVGRG